MKYEHRSRQQPHRRSLPSTSDCRHPATFAYRSLTDDLGAGEAGCRYDTGPTQYEAYVPDLLAGHHFRLDGDVAANVADAERAITALDATAKALVDTEALARLLLRAESVTSSSIEGLVVDGRRLLPAEAALAAGVAGIDVTAEEVLGNIQVMTWAVDALATAEAVTLDGLLSVHEHLLSRTRLSEPAGRIRDMPNWIGGSSFNPVFSGARAAAARSGRGSRSRTCAPSRTPTVNRPSRRPRSRPVRLGVLIAHQPPKNPQVTTAWPREARPAAPGGLPPRVVVSQRFSSVRHADRIGRGTAAPARHGDAGQAAQATGRKHGNVAERGGGPGRVGQDHAALPTRQHPALALPEVAPPGPAEVIVVVFAGAELARCVFRAECGRD